MHTINRHDETEYTSLRGGDFVVRARNGRLRTLAFSFVFSAFLIALLALNPEFSSGRLQLLSALLIVLAIPMLLALYTMQRNLDLVTGIEFQNALFSACISESHDVTLIINHDGGVIYHDRGFLRFFHGVPKDNFIDALIARGILPREDAERLYGALLQQRTEHLVITIPHEHGLPERLRLTLHPIQRPQGYYLITGRVFVETRDNAQAIASGAPMLTQADLHARHAITLMNEVPIGIYTVTPNGALQIVNYQLEVWLGYEPGEMLTAQMHLKDLHYQADNTAHDQEIKPFEGNTLLRRKNGSLIKAYVRQYVGRDDDGNPQAVLGVVDNLSLS